MDQLKKSLLAAAQGWAEHAYLRSVRSCSDRACELYTVEDALLNCMFNLWALEDLCSDS